jgi:hypothetical protein
MDSTKARTITAMMIGTVDGFFFSALPRLVDVAPDDCGVLVASKGADELVEDSEVGAAVDPGIGGNVVMFATGLSSTSKLRWKILS